MVVKSLIFEKVYTRNEEEEKSIYPNHAKDRIICDQRRELYKEEYDRVHFLSINPSFLL